MRKVIHKIFWAGEFDREDAWLNEMSAQGLALVAVSYFKYTFEPCLAGEYTIRLDLLKNYGSHTESLDYIKFVEDTGAEYLGSVNRWGYFRKKGGGDAFTLYSDSSSRINHLKRIATLLAPIALINFIIALINFYLFFGLHSMIVNLLTGLLELAIAIILTKQFFAVKKRIARMVAESNLFE